MSHERLGNNSNSSTNHQNQWQQLQSEKPAQTTDVPERSIAAPETIQGASGAFLISPKQASKHIKDQLRAGASLYKLRRGGTIKIKVPKDPHASAGYVGEADASCRHVADIYLVDTPGEGQTKLEVVDLRGDSARRSCFGLYLRGESQEHPGKFIDLQLDGPRHPKYYLGVAPQPPQEEPRAKAPQDFAVSEYVSGTHLSVQYFSDWAKQEDYFVGGYIVITDENSTNGTLVACASGQLASEVDDSNYVFAQANMTPVANEYWERRNKGIKDIHGKKYLYNDETGIYHEIIGRNTDGVNGKVQLSTNIQESTLVDSGAEAIKGLYSRLRKSLEREATEGDREEYVLRRVLETTQEALRYNAEKTDEICEPYRSSDRIMPLSRMVEFRAGVCRHQALLAASLIESLCKDGFLQGRVGVERNGNYDRGEDDFSGHQWASYRVNDDHNDDIIIDPARNCVEKRRDLLKGGEEHRARTWDYTIPR